MEHPAVVKCKRCDGRGVQTVTVLIGNHIHSQCPACGGRGEGKPCDGCDSNGSLSYQWAKAACVNREGERVMHDDGSWHYTNSLGLDIPFKTVSGPCVACKGSGLKSR